MKKYLIANWKQNKNLKEIKTWFGKFTTSYQPKSEVSVIICPSYPYLYLVSNIIKKENLERVFCGTQDVSAYEGGSHTGDVSAKQVSEFCSFSIVGHSERGESNEVIKTKLENTIKAGLTPILCLKDPTSFEESLDTKILLAWEDPTHISKKSVYSSLSNDEILSSAQRIRQSIGARTLIYGGSVNTKNIEFLDKIARFDGYLVGHASLDPNTFLNLFNKIG